MDAFNTLHIILITWFMCVAAVSPGTFTAAVYEHAVKLPATTREPVSREKALQDMMKNLKIYKQAAEDARNKGANIIVYPEDGIYGMVWNGSRDHILPFLEVVPDPSEHWNPCRQPSIYTNSDVQVFLSCLARDNALYVIANFGDVQYCKPITDPNCPSDGRYQYNADVVYDPSGNFLTKYHKYNLFGEGQFNAPTPPEIATFDTPFGRFGVFTCFDIMFERPAEELIRKYDIANVVFPTAWMDAPPFLTSVQFHSAFAYGNGINYLAANIHFPVGRFHGSGIYTPYVSTLYYDTSLQSGGRLLVQDVTIVDKPRSLRNNTYVTVSGKDRDTFTAVLFHDTHNLVPLSNITDDVRVCHNNLCCNVSVVFDSIAFGTSTNVNMFYALGAFEGLHKDLKNYYIQVCSLIPCHKLLDGTYKCGSDPGTKLKVLGMPRLKSMKMFGNFVTPYVFPSMLLEGRNDVTIAEYPNQWSYSDGYLNLESPLQKPINVASMLARVYEKDDNKD